MNLLKRMIILTLIVGGIAVVHSQPVYAHKLIIDPVEPGIVKVEFSDGTSPVATATVTVFNEKNEEIFKGPLDERGMFDYSAYDQAAYLIADDGMGHRVRWNVGDPKAVGGTSKLIPITITLIALLAVAGIFYIRSSKKKKRGLNF